MNARMASILLASLFPAAFLASPAGSAQPQMRAAPRPVVRNPNAPQADWQQPPAAGRFTALSFTVTTGDDDLRSDSAAWVNLNFQDGTKQKCDLKFASTDGWGNNTQHDNDIPQCKLQRARTFDELKKADIVLMHEGDITTGLDSEDNWNVNEVRILAQDFVNHSYPCLIDATGHPLVRLTGSKTGFDLSQTPSLC